MKRFSYHLFLILSLCTPIVHLEASDSSLLNDIKDKRSYSMGVVYGNKFQYFMRENRIGYNEKMFSDPYNQARLFGITKDHKKEWGLVFEKIRNNEKFNKLTENYLKDNFLRLFFGMIGAWVKESKFDLNPSLFAIGFDESFHGGHTLISLQEAEDTLSSLNKELKDKTISLTAYIEPGNYVNARMKEPPPPPSAGWAQGQAQKKEPPPPPTPPNLPSGNSGYVSRFSTDPKLAIVEEVRNGKYVLNIPVGDVTILNPMLSRMESGPVRLSNVKLSKNKYRYQFLKILGLCKRIGLITVSEYSLPQTPIAAMQTMGGGDKYQVAITSKGIGVSQGQTSDGEYILKTGHMKIVNIVSEKAEKAQDGEEYTILGVYKFIPTELGRRFYTELLNEKLQDQYKFSAIVKKDIFTNNYILKDFKWGYIGKSEWYSN